MAETSTGGRNRRLLLAHIIAWLTWPGRPRMGSALGSFDPEPEAGLKSAPRNELFHQVAPVGCSARIRGGGRTDLGREAAECRERVHSATSSHRLNAVRSLVVFTGQSGARRVRGGRRACRRG